VLTGGPDTRRARCGTSLNEVRFAIDEKAIRVVHQLIAALHVKDLCAVTVANHVSRDIVAFLSDQDARENGVASFLSNGDEE
jgi:hypothetical protein